MKHTIASESHGEELGADRSRRPRWECLRRWFLPPAWSVVVLSYLAVIFAFAWPQDFRNSSGTYVLVATAAFMIRTFLFHLGLLVSAIVAGAVVLRCWRLSAVGLPLVVFSIGPVLWSYLPTSPPPAAGRTVTVMSANLFGPNKHTAEMVAEVVAADPDILLLQEYQPHWHRAFQAALGSSYPHTRCVPRRDCFGLAVYSRLPLVGAVDVAIPLGRAGTPQARAVVRIGSREVVVYNIHLMPPKGLNPVREQRLEFADLLARLEREKLPIVLCGDFNFINRSAYADELKQLGLVDAHRISGWGRATTWPRLGVLRWLPGIRLDHVFLSRELTSTSSRTGVGRGSDHRPVVAEIGFAR